jgi:hypothetical protein
MPYRPIKADRLRAGCTSPTNPHATPAPFRERYGLSVGPAQRTKGHGSASSRPGHTMSSPRQLLANRGRQIGMLWWGYVDLNHGPHPYQTVSLAGSTCLLARHRGCKAIRERPLRPAADPSIGHVTGTGMAFCSVGTRIVFSFVRSSLRAGMITIRPSVLVRHRRKSFACLAPKLAPGDCPLRDRHDDLCEISGRHHVGRR